MGNFTTQLHYCLAPPMYRSLTKFMYDLKQMFQILYSVHLNDNFNVIFKEIEAGIDSPLNICNEEVGV